MADAAAHNDDLDFRSNAGVDPFKIADGVTLWRGQLVQIQAGYANHWDETGGFLGVAMRGDARELVGTNAGKLTGETSDSNPPEVQVDTSGRILRDLTVGGSPDLTKVGDLVYCADSDTANLTLTSTTNPPVGRLWRYTSTTKQDVKLFSTDAHAAGVASGTWLV